MNSRIISSRVEFVISAIVFTAFMGGVLLACYQAAQYFGFADSFPLFFFAGIITAFTVIDTVCKSAFTPLWIGIACLAVVVRLSGLAFTASAIVSGLIGMACVFAVVTISTQVWNRFKPQ